MWKATLLLASLVSLLSGCATSGPAATEPAEPQIVTRTRIIDTGCDWTRPIFVSKADVLDKETADAILAHNETGMKRCGWKPRRSATP